MINFDDKLYFSKSKIISLIKCTTNRNLYIRTNVSHVLFHIKILYSKTNDLNMYIWNQTCNIWMTVINQNNVYKESCMQTVDYWISPIKIVHLIYKPPSLITTFAMLGGRAFATDSQNYYGFQLGKTKRSWLCSSNFMFTI